MKWVLHFFFLVRTGSTNLVPFAAKSLRFLTNLTVLHGGFAQYTEATEFLLECERTLRDRLDSEVLNSTPGPQDTAATASMPNDDDDDDDEGYHYWAESHTPRDRMSVSASAIGEYFQHDCDLFL